MADAEAQSAHLKALGLDGSAPAADAGWDAHDAAHHPVAQSEPDLALLFQPDFAFARLRPKRPGRRPTGPASKFGSSLSKTPDRTRP